MHARSFKLCPPVYFTAEHGIVLCTVIQASCSFGLGSPTSQSLLASAVFVGMLLGATFWGFLADELGRKKALTASTAVVVGAGLASAGAPTAAVRGLGLLYRCTHVVLCIALQCSTAGCLPLRELSTVSLLPSLETQSALPNPVNLSAPVHVVIWPALPRVVVAAQLSCAHFCLILSRLSGTRLVPLTPILLHWCQWFCQLQL